HTPVHTADVGPAEADRDHRPRQEQRLEAQPDEIDPRPGRNELEEVVLDGGRRLRAPGRAAGGHRARVPLHTLTVARRRREVRKSYTTRVPNTPVARRVRMPRQRVTATPRRGPLPN